MGSFKPRRASADDENGASAVTRNSLRVPAAPPFLAHCRVLRASQGGGPRIMRIAYVATNTPADILDLAVPYFGRQEWIGN